MLYEALTLSDDWDVSTDMRAKQFVRDHGKTMRSQYVFPEPTPQGDELEIFSFTLRPQFKSKYGGKVILNFVDAPGEFYETYNSDARVIDKHDSLDSPSQRTTDIIDYLISCDGIILLLDPDRKEEDGDSYAALIEDLILEFQERSWHPDLESERLQQYLAFAVTKADKESLWQYAKSPVPLAKSIIGDRFYQKLARNYCYVDRRNPDNNRFAFFALSAVGRYMDKDGTWKTPVVDPAKPTSSTSTYQTGSEETTSSYSTASFGVPQSVEERLRNSRQETRNPLSQELPTLKKGVDARPFQVIEPINWLIRGIQENPPVRPHRPAS